MIELFLENSRVDVNEVFSTTLTMAIDDIKDFGTKNTTFSKTIVLPGTANNNRLFNQIFDVSARNEYDNILPNKGTNFNASVSANCIVFDNNIQVVKGVFRLLEIIVDKGMIEYECSIVGELGGFIMKVGNNKLENLDFSAYNHTYNISNITGSWTNINNGTGYVYPLIDYGTYSTNKKNFKVGTFRPALFAYEYIKKIEAASGYTFDFPLIETNRFKNLIVPNNQKVLNKLTKILLKVSQNTPYTLNIYTTSLYTVISTRNTLFTFLGPFTTNTLGEYFVNSSSNNYTGTISVAYSGVITNMFAVLTATFELRINGVGFKQITYYNIGAFNFSFTLQDFEINAGDTLSVVCIAITALGTSGTSGFLDLTINSSSIVYESNIVRVTPINLNESFEINETLPKNILQKDFLSSIIKLFNLYVFEDKDKPKTLFFKPFVDFYANAEVENWDNKIDYGSPIRIKPMSELNARYYEFNYKDDSDYYNETYRKRYNKNYGSYKYDSGFEFSKEVNKVEVIFSGTPLTGVVGDDKVVSAIMKRTGDVVGANEDTTDSNIRLLQIKRITGVATWHIHNSQGNTNLWTGTEYLYAGHFDDPDSPNNDINFGVPDELFFELATGSINVNQFNVYWSSYMAEITDKDSRLLTAKARLTPIDINNLDFSKLKQINGVLWRLNKIEEWNASKEDVCNVELLKVINKIY